MSETNKIKVTVITGFLGAGKTTFINSLLKHHQATRFALVENEFGEVSIDSKLIKGVDASQMFELKQGCICCTISGEFELVLHELAERFPDVEHLLIETTGIADPAQVIRPFFSDESLKKIYQYNGSVCLVDAINFINYPEKEISTKQIVVADLILISKTETLTKIQKEAIKNSLQKINAFAEIDFTALAFSSAKATFEGFGVIPVHLNHTDSFFQKTKAKFDFETYTSPHSHLSTQTLYFNKPLKKEEFIHQLSYTLDVYKNQIYRTKGIICFENEPYEFILQGVGGSFEIVEGDLILDPIQSFLVFIGRNIPPIKF